MTWLSRDPGGSLPADDEGREPRRFRHYLGDAFVVEHVPGPLRGSVSETGLVLMPPFGYEDTCAYRPLRVLADTLARDGHVVIRIDWPSLGDSAFDAFQVDLVANGRAVVDLAMRSLRKRGLRRIAGIGVRGGGLIAMSSPELDELVLWGVPPSGQAYLREERAFHQTAVRAYGQVPEGACPLPGGAVEAGGFVYGPGTVRALQELSAVRLASEGRFQRVLLIGRDGLAAPATLLAAFEQAGTQVSVSSAPGLGVLLENSYHSELRPEVTEAIRSWLAVHTETSPFPPPEGPTRLRIEGGITERPVVLKGGVGELSGILCEPPGGLEPGRIWTLFLNAGGIRRSGPNRLWTRAARLLAAEGRPSLRFDVRDVGDSDGATVPHADLEAMYSESSIQDVVQVYDWARAQGACAVDVVGLCSGSYLGIQLAARRQVRRALLFNGLAFVWNDDARASGVTSHLGASLFDARRWRRLLTGRISAVGVVRAIFSKAVLATARAFAGLRGSSEMDEVEVLFRAVADRGTHIRLVSSEGDPSISYLQHHISEEHRPDLTVLSGVDHTIRPVWAHSIVMELISKISTQT